jgi:DNA polymerase-3 subunit epsilon
MNRKKKFIWKIDRPIAFFDIEATGIYPRTDRIVELAIVRIMPDQSRQSFVSRINPCISIPAEATKIHGITDKDVAGCPKFMDIAPDVLRMLEGCDLAGYNILRYDIPMLLEEMLRVGASFDLLGRRIIDAQRIFHKKEPRDLTAAVAFYCGEMHLAAHGAEADTLATIRVVEGQYEKYTDLPMDMDELDKYCNPGDPSWVDRTGRLKWEGGEIVINFGKRKGERLKDIIEKDPSFVKWIMRSDFPRDMQFVIQNASEGKWPAMNISRAS